MRRTFGLPNCRACQRSWFACIWTHISALVPRAASRRSAISALIPALPFNSADRAWRETPRRLATSPSERIGDIVAGKRSITADTDLRLCRFFGLSNGYWLRAQAAHDTEVAEREIGPQLGNIRPWTLAVREPSRKYRVRVAAKK
jgi:addiction module HigA family antidote